MTKIEITLLHDLHPIALGDELERVGEHIYEGVLGGETEGDLLSDNGQKVGSWKVEGLRPMTLSGIPEPYPANNP